MSITKHTPSPSPLQKITQNETYTKRTRFIAATKLTLPQLSLTSIWFTYFLIKTNDACLLFVSHAFYMYCDIKWVLHNKIVQCRILTYNLFLKNITTSFKTFILI